MPLKTGLEPCLGGSRADDTVLVLEGLDATTRASILAFVGGSCSVLDRVQFVDGQMPMPRSTRNPWSTAGFENIQVLLQLDDTTFSYIGRLQAYRVTERFGLGLDIELEVHAPHVNLPRHRF